MIKLFSFFTTQQILAISNTSYLKEMFLKHRKLNRQKTSKIKSKKRIKKFIFTIVCFHIHFEQVFNGYSCGSIANFD